MNNCFNLDMQSWIHRSEGTVASDPSMFSKISYMDKLEKGKRCVPTESTLIFSMVSTVSSAA